MRKILLLIMLSFLFLIGCDINNTPTSKVEELFSKYQNLDDDIEEEIENILSDESLSLSQKNSYKELLRKQYRNIVYNIKDEIIDGDDASVIVEIEVLDYKNAIDELEKEYIGNDDFTIEDYNDKKIDILREVKDRINYTLELSLIKNNDGDWKLQSLGNVNKQKIQGMY